MRTIFFIIGLLTVMIRLSANPGFKLDSLLVELDKVIANEKEYATQKLLYLNKLKDQLSAPNVPEEEQYLVNYTLAKEYEPFMCDSAIFYASKALLKATTLENRAWIYDSKIQLARNKAKAGLFLNVLELLGTVNAEDLNKHQKIDYYKAYTDVYIFMIEYQDGYDIAELTKEKEIYRTHLLQLLDPNTFEYAISYGFYYIEKGDFERAENILTSYYSKVKPGTKEMASIASILSHLYGQKREEEKQKEYLAISAISDIRASVKENISLRVLAILLFNDGDIVRAHQYIKKSLDDANFYNARLRNIQTSKILPIIDNAYQLDKEAQQKKQQILFVAISILSVILLITIILIVLQMSKLKKAKGYIEEVNSRLNELNVVLQEANKQQKQTNINLAESNHIKEKFISNFLEICTEYIEKLDAFKRLVNRKIKSGQANDLLGLTSKSENPTELKELYANFDKAFLNIYPTFVEEFNTLLREDERYPINNDRSLNQELRIFALIKLDIRDTNKIATFLHYTPRTVYNYRSKVKSKALDCNEDLEIKIKNICTNHF